MTEILRAVARALSRLIGRVLDTVDPEALDDPDTAAWWAVQHRLEPHGTHTEVCAQCGHFWHIPLRPDGLPDMDLFAVALIEHCLDDTATHTEPLIRFEELT